MISDYIFKNNIEFEEEWLEQAILFVKRLSDSGYDSDFSSWGIEQTNESVRLKSFYRIYDHYGHGSGKFVYFTVILPKDPEKKFKLQFNGAKSQYLARKRHLRHYIESYVSNCLGIGQFLPEQLLLPFLCDES
tara:strand:+ start:2848 stop:3246 length:399 start_codon:yes stop_codon:yes gene_type:complete